MLLSSDKTQLLDESALYFCPRCGSEGTLSKTQEGMHYEVEIFYRCMSHQGWGEELVRSFACEEIAKLRKQVNEGEQNTVERIVQMLHTAIQKIDEETQFSEPFKSGLLSGMEEAIVRIQQESTQNNPQEHDDV